jgi:hypothetical protein
MSVSMRITTTAGNEAGEISRDFIEAAVAVLRAAQRIRIEKEREQAISSNQPDVPKTRKRSDIPKPTREYV